ncbi:MAG TPA: tetratricopeptide repeat protein [Candidatus Obscuribacterales bacterium]
MSIQNRELEVLDLTNAAAALKSHVGSHAPVMIHVLRPLVARLTELNRHEEAQQYLEEILVIRRKSASPVLPALTEAYYDYAQNLRKQDKHAEAWDIIVELLAEVADEGKNGTLYEAEVRLMLADSQEKMSARAQAMTQLRKALDIFLKLDQLARAYSVSNHLARLLAEQGQTAEAVAEAERAYTFGVRMVGEESHAIIPIMETLLRFYSEAGLRDKWQALETRRRALKREMDR